MELLRLKNLAIGENTKECRVLVEDVNFSLNRGETIGIVGESGSGKTVTTMSIPNLLPGDLKIARGNIFFEGRDLAVLSEKDMEEIRGKEIGIIFQNPISSLNPLMRVGKQIAEVIRRHRNISEADIQKLVLEVLEDVGFTDPEAICRRYPHELSGGQGQRIGIAMAIANSPKLIIADECTTALDVTIQAQILSILKKIQKKYDTAMIFISHDLGVIRTVSDKILVMYYGQVVEGGYTKAILETPRHHYTKGLIDSLPENFKRGERIDSIEGTIPSRYDKIEGCYFEPRCFRKIERCSKERVPLTYLDEEHCIRCINPL